MSPARWGAAGRWARSARPSGRAARASWRRAGVVAALVLVAAGCTSGGGDESPAHATPPTGAPVPLPTCPAVGPASTAAEPLPDLSLACLGGGDALALRRLTGTPTVLNLWASWCGPCKVELPAFARLDQAAGPKLRVLGVATSDVPSKAESYAGDAGLPFPSLVDRDGDLRRGLRRTGMPVTVLVRADGSVADVYQGVPLTDTTLRALVREKLGVDV